MIKQARIPLVLALLVFTSFSTNSEAFFLRFLFGRRCFPARRINRCCNLNGGSWHANFNSNPGNQGGGGFVPPRNLGQGQGPGVLPPNHAANPNSLNSMNGLPPNNLPNNNRGTNLPPIGDINFSNNPNGPGAPNANQANNRRTNASNNITQNDSSGNGAPSSSIENFVNWVNQVRATAGQGPVVYNSTLSQEADANNDQQLARGMGHHYMGDAHVQNASGSGDLALSATMWYQDPPHYKNLVAPGITQIGIACKGNFCTFNGA